MELITTDAKIDENVVYSSYVHKNKFSTNDSVATMVAKVRAMAGTQAKILLRPANTVRTTGRIIDTTEFDISAPYYHWHPISLKSLPKGLYAVEYYLNDLCWASTDFEFS